MSSSRKPRLQTMPEDIDWGIRVPPSSYEEDISSLKPISSHCQGEDYYPPNMLEQPLNFNDR